MSDYALSEVNRQVSNMLRLGTIAQVDAKTYRVKVNVSGLTTDWLPWKAERAGKTKRWSVPSVGEQVILGAPYGDLEQAVILGSIFHDGSAPPAQSEDQDTTVFPDGTSLDYNSKTNTFTLTVTGAGNVVVVCKNATIRAATKITAETPELHCTGKITSDGDMIAGSISLQNHLHREQGDGNLVSKPQ